MDLQRTDPVDKAAIIHEAAHAVAGEAQGLSVNRVAVGPKRNGFTEFEPNLDTLSTDAQVAVLLAGLAAEMKFYEIHEPDDLSILFGLLVAESTTDRLRVEQLGKEWTQELPAVQKLVEAQWHRIVELASRIDELPPKAG